MRLYGVAELGVRDLGIRIHVNSSHKRHQFIFQGIVSVLLEEDPQIVDVHFSFVLSVDGLEAAERGKVMSLLKLNSQLL